MSVSDVLWHAQRSTTPTPTNCITSSPDSTVAIVAQSTVPTNPSPPCPRDAMFASQRNHNPDSFKARIRKSRQRPHPRRVKRAVVEVAEVAATLCEYCGTDQTARHCRTCSSYLCSTCVINVPVGHRGHDIQPIDVSGQRDESTIPDEVSLLDDVRTHIVLGGIDTTQPRAPSTPIERPRPGAHDLETETLATRYSCCLCIESLTGRRFECQDCHANCCPDCCILHLAGHRLVEKTIYQPAGQNRRDPVDVDGRLAHANDEIWENIEDCTSASDSGNGLSFDDPANLPAVRSAHGIQGGAEGTRSGHDGLENPSPGEDVFEHDRPGESRDGNREDDLEELEEDWEGDLEDDLEDGLEESANEAVSCRRSDAVPGLPPQPHLQRHIPPGWRNEFERLLVDAMAKAAVAAAPQIMEGLSRRGLQKRLPQRSPLRNRAYHELLDFELGPRDEYDFPVPRRRNTSRRMWSDDERRQLQDYVDKGWTKDDIARVMHRTISAVTQQWRKQN